MTKSEGISKRFDYIPNRIESVKNLNTSTKIRDPSSRVGQQSCFFFIFGEKMVGSAAIKQGRSANRKHTYFWGGGLTKSLARSAKMRSILILTRPVVKTGINWSLLVN